MAKILLAKFFGVGMPLDLRQVDTKQGEYLTELRESGFLDFAPCEPPTEQPGKSVVESYNIIGGKLVQSWNVQDLPENDAG
ncbi:hypothetical protein [uncultured Alistipes sp.]|uniref:hypothetical protein n=1 Tax=uncultured Alistipes sp. TaxID=538949 RepID=UPI002729F760|nr:hypothetical protein [uncultured Alistipes sp.]